MKLQAVVVGASGLVGSYIVKELLAREQYHRVNILVRKKIDLEHPKLQQLVVNWDRIEEYSEAFEGVRDVFCALGTTIKKAGSQEQFARVDLSYPVQVAAMAKKAGAEQFLMVSAIGADASSRIFYNRIKGEAEEQLAAVGLPSLQLFRPSLILGEREDKRLGEGIAAWVMTALDGLFRKGKAAQYRAIPAQRIARAMVNIAQVRTPGVQVYPNEVIHVLGGETS